MSLRCSRIAALMITIGVLAPAYAQAPKFQDVAVNPSAYPLIAVEFELLTPGGELLTSLEASQVAIEEPGAGEATRISGELSKAGSEGGVAYLIAIDTSGSMKSLLADIRAALAGFVEQLGDADRVAIVTFNNDVEVVRRFTGDRADLLTSIGELVPGGTTTELYYGVIRGLDEFDSDGLPRRRVAIVISDGKDEGPAYTLDSCIERARASNVDILGLGITSGDSRALLNVRRLAEETGGFFIQFDKGQDWSAKLDLVRRHVESRWRFAWRTTLPGDGMTHDVLLLVSLGNVTVSEELAVEMPLVRDVAEERRKLVVILTCAVIATFALAVVVLMIMRGRKTRAAEAEARLAEERVRQAAAQTALGEQLQEVTRRIDGLDRVQPNEPGPTPPCEAGESDPSPLSSPKEPNKRRTVFAAASVSDRPPYDTAALVYLAGPRAGSRVPLSQGRVTLGREEDNNVVLDEDRVSRHHAAITEENGVFWLEDLGSANGTFVNESLRITGRHALASGDTLRLGGVVFRFVGEVRG
jgi:Mg-chelatase subunit ChlD